MLYREMCRARNEYEDLEMPSPFFLIKTDAPIDD